MHDYYKSTQDEEESSGEHNYDDMQEFLNENSNESVHEFSSNDEEDVDCLIIKTVQKHQCLYNSKIRYPSKKLKDETICKARKEISEELKRSGTILKIFYSVSC